VDRLPVNPSWRSLAGIFLILGLIAAWSVAVVAGYDFIAGAAWPLQALYFLVAGTIWVLPLKPLLRWMAKNGASDGT
jgi:hypothetical protein